MMDIAQQADLYLTMKRTNPGMLAPSILQNVINLPEVLTFLARQAFKTNDQTCQDIKDKAIVLADRDEPVLVCGESGVGKELIAEILHGKRTGTFTPVNVCAVTDTLFESELFGHVKGSFTGAFVDRDGLITQAAGGTLFLDEIGDMPLPLQAKILRVIHNKTFRKVGSNRDEEVRCRIVAATHRDLPAMIRAQQFRLDLYQRLGIFKLRIPPLRRRWQTDASLYASSETITCIENMSQGMEIRMTGNVRQLQSLDLQVKVFGCDSLTIEEIQ